MSDEYIHRLNDHLRDSEDSSRLGIETIIDDIAFEVASKNRFIERRMPAIDDVDSKLHEITLRVQQVQLYELSEAAFALARSHSSYQKFIDIDIEPLLDDYLRDTIHQGEFCEGYCHEVDSAVMEGEEAGTARFLDIIVPDSDALVGLEGDVFYCAWERKVIETVDKEYTTFRPIDRPADGSLSFSLPTRIPGVELTFIYAPEEKDGPTPNTPIRLLSRT